MRLRILFLILLFFGLFTACNLLNPAVPEPPPGSELPASANDGVLEPAAAQNQPPQVPLNPEMPELATPVADSPAAGICATFEGEWVTVTIHPDIPEPRCAVIKPEQMLEVVNDRGETLTVAIGQMQAELAPDESVRFEQPFGEYLLPGVHRLDVRPCCGAELVFEKGH
jgi:hypothetical protein